jgi:hypothetical protein
MPFFSKKNVNGEYEIYNAETGQVYSKYNSSKKAKYALLDLRMAYHLGMKHLGDDIVNQIDKLVKHHHKKYIEGVINKFKEGGSRKLYKTNKKHKKTRRA